MNSIVFFVPLFFILISVPSSSTQGTGGLAVFSSASETQPDSKPSWQLIFRNIGLGSMTDPVFNVLKRRWDSIRANPFIQALLVQTTGSGSQPSAQPAMRYARSISRQINRIKQNQ
ncbi:uncharacterized protein LOC107365227 [Tetranychus urticae]|uniref:Secreted protein n=1 Tax=Tetranychus urticae TaxID=32264 RepID=T1JS36_TETUR|nr:uncharacterized protein LOC107365227 [Tetranychus urticae]